MNTHKPSSDIETYLRHLVEPDASTVQRVLARAFRDPSPKAAPRRRWAWPAATVAAILVSAIVFWRWPQGPASRLEESTLTITGDPTLVVVEREDGRRWVVGPASSGADTGDYVIVVER